MAEGAMAAFLTDIGTFFTECVGWATDILSNVTAEPALTVLVLGFPIVGGYLALPTLNSVNCWNIPQGRSAAKPIFGNVQRLSF